MHPTPVKTDIAAEKQNPPLFRDRDIVVIGLQPWYYEIGSNCKNIATQFARHNRVLYVNLPINRKTFYASDNNAGVTRHCEIIRGKGEQLRSIGPNMWEYYPACIVESINWLPSTAAFKFVNYFNNRRFAREIRKALATLNFEDVILFNDNDIYNGFNLKALLAPALSIYYCRDFLQGYDYWKKHCTILEPELVRKSDLVVTNSTYYAEYCSGFNPRSFYMGQGCNIELFDTERAARQPEDTRDLKSPVIGYVGALDAVRLDLSAIEQIAKAHPEWSVVLVGPEDDIFAGSALHQMSNVHFLGRKPLSQLPDYIRTFDVCINPQLINIVTMGNYPLKVDEYLAMGKPVVASRTKAMQLFETYTYLADGPEQYVGLIEQALEEDDEERRASRISFARGHTWENSMLTLYRIILDAEKQKAR